jgi:outer membrane immunogenic protein
VKRIYLPAILAMLGSASGLAADLSSPPRMYAKAASAPADPAYNWSGFYGGVNGGYANDPATATFDPVAYTTTAVQQPTWVALFALNTPPFGLSATPKGGFGGVQLGYNWQPAQSHWVLGIEADASFGRLRAEDSKPFGAFVGVFGDDAENSVQAKGIARLSQTIDAFGTVRGRLGYAANTLLVYATGGAAWAHTKTRFGVDNVVVLNSAGLTDAQLASLTAGTNATSEGYRYGYAAGGGAEWAFARNWSVKAEYVYLNFTRGSSTLVIPGGVAHAGNFDMHTAKGGINYHFN